MISVPHGVAHGAVSVKKREKSKPEVIRHEGMTRAILIASLIQVRHR